MYVGLGKRGILALLTPQNNPWFDTVVVAPDDSRTVTIQLKTMSEYNGIKSVPDSSKVKLNF